ncbi:MAG: L-aspartate oxidase [Endomicrobium sp.]|nr:L-aspartate oxidase [Endomicrobium sp.]
MEKFDYLIIGSGLAGLSLALKVSQDSNNKIALVSKKTLSHSSTVKAQGGIACVIDSQDSFISHIHDTIKTGDGLCNEQVVNKLVVEAPIRINELIQYGVNFTKKDKDTSMFDLGLEGGHSHRRILHCDDMTGLAIETILLNKIKQCNNIKIYEYYFGIDLILDNHNTCIGAYFANTVKNCIEIFISKITVLACGGIGQAYLYTSNPDISTGDGIAMAYRAGANIANMEFIQFHPTCLYINNTSFLISEALRGEGGILKLKNGSTFMHKYHVMKDLAPRDIISRAIDTELKKSNETFVYLDITSKNKDFLIKRFPNIYYKCLQYGIAIEKDYIPVQPVAHFVCGGVIIDENGRTTIQNLYSVGETACSGLHGANRLASNSLLECLVYANRISVDSAQFLKRYYLKNNISFTKQYTFNNNSNSSIDINPELLLKIKSLAWTNLGICRSNKQITYAYNQITIWKNELKNYLRVSNKITQNVLELRNIINIVEMIAKCSTIRKESRGTYFNVDHLHTNSNIQNTIINIAEEGI